MKLTLNLPLLLLLIIVFFPSSCQKELSCENCKGNKHPIANAGADQIIVLPKDSVTLDGTASRDPDGTIVKYKWARISGPLSSNILKTDSSKTLVKTMLMGVYKFEITVTDNGGLSAKDTVQIIVNDPAHNQPPIAKAGADQTITLPMDSILLNGNLSFDPDGTITTYKWLKISGSGSSYIVSPDSSKTTIKTLTAGVYQFELQVKDNGGLSGKDTIQVTVNSVATNNLPPIAKAGNDTIIQTNQTSCTLVPVSFTLNGSNSYDPDGNIVSYQWVGPGNITSPNSAITTVSGTFAGAVEFILKVTDNNGSVGYDSVLINVMSFMSRPLVAAQLIPIGTLSQTRRLISVGSASGKILFAGGWPSPGGSTRVDIYDVATNSWSIAELSKNIRLGGVATLGNKVFFAGGLSDSLIGPGFYDGIASSRIDIYDASTNIWSTAELSSARSRLRGATSHNKVVFAGSCFNCVTGTNCTNCGEHTGRVDIYDADLGTWSTSELSFPREVGSGSVIGDKIYFSGGIYQDAGDNILPSSRIDIYDAHFNTWSTAELNQPRGWLAGIAVGTKNYWAGGGDNTVEIRDANTQSQSLACLFQPNNWEYACSLNTSAQKNNKIVFFTEHDFHSDIVHDKFDIYDITTGTWSIGVLPVNIYEASIISVNNIIYVAGGFVNGVISNQVYKLEF